MDLGSASEVSSLGTVEVADAQDLFGFDGPPVGSIGWSPIPTLSFRVTTLGGRDDGHTLLTMLIPHVITDAMGAGGLVETWGRLYSGEKVPTRTGNPHPDLLEILDAVPAGDSTARIKDDEWPGRGFKTGIIDVLSYARSTWSLASRGFEERYIHFPRRLLEKYRDEARGRLEPGLQGPIVSIHDVLCAMMLKVRIQTSPRDASYW